MCPLFRFLKTSKLAFWRKESVVYIQIHCDILALGKATILEQDKIWDLKKKKKTQTRKQSTEWPLQLASWFLEKESSPTEKKNI